MHKKQFEQVKFFSLLVTKILIILLIFYVVMSVLNSERNIDLTVESQLATVKFLMGKKPDDENKSE